METKMTTNLLDDAACDAVGALSPVESATYQQTLAAADESTRAADRQLRETAARLAAASPHMTPPPELRGRILQATAPASFRLADYKKATGEDFRFYKWGFYAAACFLIAGALYNIQTRNNFSQALNKANGINVALNEQNKQLATAALQRNEALKAFVNPNGVQITLQDAQGHPFSRGVIDPSTKRALLIFPEEAVPAGTVPQLTFTEKHDGKDVVVAYQTAILTAPAVQIGFAVPAGIQTNVANLDVKKTTRDESSKPIIATFP